jgi:hypothetical protein
MFLLKITNKQFLCLFLAINNMLSNCSDYNPDQWVNVYIHGTFPDCKLLSNYFDSLFLGESGLHHASKLNSKNLFKKNILSLCYLDPNKFCFEHFYTFGWSGALSFPARKKTGIILYNQLKDLILSYKQLYNLYPKIRIITYSHGGNVALNMVKLLPFIPEQHIHLELLFIACPVQKPLASYIKHPEVDFVYTISTENDWVQGLNFYQYKGKYQFPNQLFDTTCKKCYQINVSIDGHSIGHLDLFRSFLVHLPYTLAWADMNFNPNQDSNVLNLTIYDDKFISYNGLNLLSILYGLRKN